MNDAKVIINAQEKASRAEWVIRFIYMIPLFIVLWVLSIIAMIGIVVNFFTSILLGKRIQALNNFVALYISYTAQVHAYLYVTDERPEIIPKM